MDATLAGLPVRDLRPDDADAVIALIGSVYAEYPGCVMDLPGVDDDLPELADRLAAAGGQGWVVTNDDAVVACVGVAPIGEGTAELKRLYVAASHRRRGLGRALVALVEAHAVEAFGARTVSLWSDSRFLDAHRLYRQCGYEATGETRQLHDPSDTTEHRFVRHLPG
jgi:putative acetyltransferase